MRRRRKQPSGNGLRRDDGGRNTHPVEKMIFTKKRVDKRLWLCYYNARAQPKHPPNARVVELVDSLASGASALYGRAGSTPASRTNPVDISSTGFFSSTDHAAQQTPGEQSAPQAFLVFGAVISVPPTAQPEWRQYSAPASPAASPTNAAPAAHRWWRRQSAGGWAWQGRRLRWCRGARPG